MVTNRRKRYFPIDENANSEQIYALLDYAESGDKDNINSLINDSDTELTAEEEITQPASTQTLFWLHQGLIFTQYQVTISQRRKKIIKKKMEKNYGSGSKP